MVLMQGARMEQKFQARLLAESGIARAEYFLNGGDGRGMLWETEAYEEVVPKYGKIKLRCDRHGLFALLNSTGSRVHATHTIAGLAGRRVPNELTPTLTLTGKAGGIAVDGGASVVGRIVLRHGDVVRGSSRIPARGYADRISKIQSPSLPFDNQPIVDEFEYYRSRLKSASSDTATLVGTALLSDTVINTANITIAGDCTIESARIVGSDIRVTGRLRLGAGAVCEACSFTAERVELVDGVSRGCVFYAEKDQQLTGGKHESQFFGSDTIRVGKDAQFGPTTSWVSYRRVVGDTALTGALIFESGGTYRGTAISFMDTTNLSRSVTQTIAIHIDPNVEFRGSLVTDGDIHMEKPDIRGHFWARAVTTRHNKVAYTNWIWSGTLRPPEETHVFPLLGSTPARVMVTLDLQWVRGKQTE